MKDIIPEIKACLGVHPAIRFPFDDLYKGIMNEVSLGNVTRQVKDDLELFNYTRQCTYEGNWNVYSIISRGLILCPSQKKVVALSMPKFANYGEVLYIPEEPFRATVKYDGSCIFCWNFQGKWHCSTRGSFTSDQAIWAEKWMNSNVNMSALNPNHTYIFECIYKENKIVINYDFEGLVLITIYDNCTGYEMLYENVVSTAKQLRTRVVDAPGFTTIEEMLKKAELLPSNEEGWVVRFDNGYRIKVKGAEYLRIHRLVSNCTPLAVWDLLRNCMDLEPLIRELPEEFSRDIKVMKKIFEAKENTHIHNIYCLHKLTSIMTDKELGLKIPELAKTYPIAAYFIFACRKNNFLEEVRKPGKLRFSLWEKFRPTANVLEGFVPSSAMNRFEEDL